MIRHRSDLSPTEAQPWSSLARAICGHLRLGSSSARSSKTISLSPPEISVIVWGTERGSPRRGAFLVLERLS
jgi:hypothetical protein